MPPFSTRDTGTDTGAAADGGVGMGAEEGADGSEGLVSRNVTIEGRRTSIRLEPQMWLALAEIATLEKRTLHELCTLVKLRKRASSSVTAAIRVFLMAYYRESAMTNPLLHRAHHDRFPVLERALRAVGIGHEDESGFRVLAGTAAGAASTLAPAPVSAVVASAATAPPPPSAMARYTNAE